MQVRQRRRNVIWHPLHVDSKKKWYTWTYLQNRKRLTDLESKGNILESPFTMGKLRVKETKLSKVIQRVSGRDKTSGCIFLASKISPFYHPQVSNFQAVWFPCIRDDKATDTGLQLMWDAHPDHICIWRELWLTWRRASITVEFPASRRWLGHSISQEDPSGLSESDL